MAKTEINIPHLMENVILAMLILYTIHAFYTIVVKRENLDGADCSLTTILFSQALFMLTIGIEMGFQIILTSLSSGSIAYTLAFLPQEILVWLVMFVCVFACGTISNGLVPLALGLLCAELIVLNQNNLVPSWLISIGIVLMAVQILVVFSRKEKCKEVIS